jgi:hypothetical protein
LKVKINEDSYIPSRSDVNSNGKLDLGKERQKLIYNFKNHKAVLNSKGSLFS